MSAAELAPSRTSRDRLLAEGPGGRGSRTSSLPGRFLRSELGIVFGRRRNLVLLGVLVALPVVLAIAIKVSSGSDDGRGGGGPGFFEAITSNGLFVAFAAL